MSSKKDNAARAGELLEAAIRSTLAVLNDDKTPPTARASAASTAVALHKILLPDDPTDKEASEMSYDELQASIESLKKRRDNVME
ncbi:MAG TPA: hypothetical protein GYA10_10525 [Alphaproteobacteria bacterium]|nr:hypothetical protein [Alphaproteobacteria bacterium]